MKEQQSGFTLIELIVVIVILGILAAVAIPKFSDLTADARRATVNGAVAALNSASVITHATWIARGANPGTAVLGTQIIIEGGQVVGMGSTGYPADNAAPTQVASVPTMTAATCVNAWTAIMGTGSMTAAIASGAGVDFVASVAASPTCVFTYQTNGAAANPARTFTYNANTGAVVVTANP